MKPPFSFDRAAGYYDDTRGFPPGMDDIIIASLAANLPPGARLLEIGVGTGRIAIPLLNRSVKVTGVDVSRKMMEVLLEKRPSGEPRPALIQGDAALLPLRNSSFDAVIGVHVLHLIPLVGQVIREVRRILRPGGSFYIGHEERLGSKPYSRLREKFREIAAGYTPPEKQGLRPDSNQIQRTLDESGAKLHEWEAARWQSSYTLANRLEELRHRKWSATWMVPDEHYPEVMDRLHRWASETYGDLERRRHITRNFIWSQYTWEA